MDREITDPTLERRCPLRADGEVADVESRVPEAGDALVVLDDDPIDGRIGIEEIDRRGHHVIEGAEVLGTLGVVDAGLGEQLASFGLRPEVGIRGIRTVHRDPEAHGQFTVGPRRHERDEVSSIEVDDQVPDPGDEAGSVEDLLGERPVPRLHRRHEEQTPAGVALDHPWHEVEVVVDDVGVDGLTGDEDHPRPWLAEE